MKLPVYLQRGITNKENQLKTTILLIAIVCHASQCVAQSVRTIRSGSRQSIRLRNEIRESFEEVASNRGTPGYLGASTMKVGHTGYSHRIDAKVLQIVDDKTVILRVRGSHSTTFKNLVAVTKLDKSRVAKLRDNLFFRGKQWKEKLGADRFVVAGVYRYKNVLGAKRVILRLEPKSRFNRKKTASSQ